MLNKCDKNSTQGGVGGKTNKPNQGTALVILTPSAISKSGTGLLLQLETTILSPAAEAVARYLS